MTKDRHRSIGKDLLIAALKAVERFRAGDAEPTVEDFLAAHEDLRDLLEPMLEGEDAASPASFTLGPDAELGDFRLVREIGRGGMGVVFEARQISLGRRVAVKVLPPSALLLPVSLARFKREAHTAASLGHPGIVAVYAVGTDHDIHWFAMELVEGEPLNVWAAGVREADPDHYVRRVVEIIARVADALEHAHAAGVLHRDVKPNNILVRGDDEPVLTDFGLARRQGLPSVTQTGEFAGTPHYVSPEQARSENAELDARSDVFSLGVTLYELLARKLPFVGDTTRDVLNQILTREPRPLWRVDPVLPRDLGAVVCKALEKSPRARYASAGGLAEELRRFLNHQPVHARPPGLGRRIAGWVRREPLRAALAGAALLLLLLAGHLIATQQARLRGEHALLAERLEEIMLDNVLAPWSPGGTSRIVPLEDLLAAAPDDALLVVAVARTWSLPRPQGKGEPERALRLLEDRPEMLAAHPGMRLTMASVLNRLGRGDEAATLRQDLPPPRSSVDHYAHGRDAMSRWARGDWDAGHEAVDAMLRAVALSERPRALCFLGLSEAGRSVGDWEKIRAAGDALAQNWPESAVAWVQKAMAWLPHDRAVGMAALQRSLELEPDNLLALHAEFTLASSDGDQQRASALLERMRRLYPEQMQLFEAKGQHPR